MKKKILFNHGMAVIIMTVAVNYGCVKGFPFTGTTTATSTSTTGTAWTYTGPAPDKMTAIRALMDSAAMKNNPDVVYIVSGDSTRDSYVAGQEFIYGSHLDQLNIEYVHNARSGLQAYHWVRDTVADACLAKAIDHSTGNGENAIMEFSLGINDVNGWGLLVAKESIIESLTSYMAAKPQAHIILVVPVTTGAASSDDLATMYSEVAVQLDLPLINEERVLNNAYYDTYDRYYYDGTHPNHFGAIRMTKYILDMISGSMAIDNWSWTMDYFTGSTGQSAGVDLADGKAITANTWYWPNNNSPTTDGGELLSHASYSTAAPFSVNENSLIEISGENSLYRVTMMGGSGDLVYSFDETVWKNHSPRYVYVPDGVTELRLTLKGGTTPLEITYLNTGELTELDSDSIYYSAQ